MVGILRLFLLNINIDTAEEYIYSVLRTLVENMKMGLRLNKAVVIRGRWGRGTAVLVVGMGILKCGIHPNLNSRLFGGNDRLLGVIRRRAGEGRESAIKMYGQNESKPRFRGG